MPEFKSPNLTLLIKLQLQAEVLVPILNKLRETIGREEANKLIADSLRSSTKISMKHYVNSFQHKGRAKWDAIMEDADSYIGDDVSLDVLENNERRFDFNVTKCKYAEFFNSIGEAELGAILACECDDHIANEFDGQVEFLRTKTIMSGSDHCDFRYKYNFDD